MANDLSFNITARDQASRAVETVQKKIQGFGADLAKSFLSIAGPMAVVQMGLGAIQEAIENYKKKVAEAVDYAKGLTDRATELKLTTDEMQRLENAAAATGVSVEKLAASYSDLKALLASSRGGEGDTARMLQALGFAAQDIADGLVTPIQVIEKLGAAMSGAGDDTKALAIATAVLGKDLADKLLPILQRAKEAAEGFGEGAGITAEEAEFIRQSEVNKKREANRERARLAKREVVGSFLETDPEGQRILSEVQAQVSRQAAGGAGVAPIISSTVAASMPEVQAQVAAILKARRETANAAAREANAATAAAVEAEAARQESQRQADAAAAAIQAEEEAYQADLAKETEDANKQRQKENENADKLERERVKADLDAIESAKKESARTGGGKLTVSSLREIGGAMLGEGLAATAVNYEKETLDIQTKILIELQKMNISEPPLKSIDFTKINQA